MSAGATWWSRALALTALSDPRFVPVAIGGLFGVLSLRSAIEPFGDQDAPWIATAGREMIASGAVPRTNAWSITDAAVPWVMHEWGLAPLYAWSTEVLGLAGPVVLGCLAAALTVSLLAHATIGRARHLGAGALACVVAISLVRECLFQPRPAYVCLGLPIAMALLALVPRLSIARAAGCVLLELAWANLHGSFPLGLVILALGIASYGDDRGKRLGALALAALATLATPYGLDLIELVDRYVRGGDDAAAAIHAHIAEFQPLWAAGPVFGGAPRVIAVVLVAIGAVFGIARGTRAERLAAALAAALALLAVLHARHVPQAVAIGAVLLVPVFDRVVDAARLRVASVDGVAIARRTGLAVLVLAGLASTLACVRGVHADDALGGDALPSLAHDPRASGRAAYVAFDAAGRYLWLGRPSARVFFDPRNDCYRADTATRAFEIEEGTCEGECATRALLDAGVEVAIVPDEHTVARALAASPDFVEARELDGWHLFVRRGGR